MLDIIRSGDRRYDAVRHVYRAKGSPAAVVRPRSQDEVAQALAFARAADGPISIRSGGHGMSSISTNEGGTVIDLGALDRVTRLGDRRVRLEPGTRWGRVARVLDPWGLAISSGDSGDVGVGGLATTGGIGLMSRAHGLTIDALERARIVVADGRALTVSADEHPDLFWAIRGAGANFGIVTSFEFRAAMTADVARGQFTYAIRDLREFLETWGRVVEAAPREITAFLYLVGGRELFAQATVVFAGDDADAAARELGVFAGFPGVVGQHASMTRYAEVLMTSGAPHSGQQSAITHTGLADHLDSTITARLAEMMSTGVVQMLQVRSVGGAVNDVAVDATAYAHRHQNFSITAVAPSGDRSSFDAVWAPVRESLDGMYLSFESDHTPEQLHDAFPAPTLDRLRQLKRVWDPDHVFVQNFHISEP